MSGLGTMPLDTWTEQKGRDNQYQANLRIRQYGRKYVIQTSRLVDSATVLNFPGLPQRFQPFPTDPGAVCIITRPEQNTSNPFIWFCHVEYTSDYILEDFEDPQFKIPEVEWEFEERQLVCPGLLKKVSKATSGGSGSDPVRTNTNKLLFSAYPCNSAGEPFDPPPLYDKADPVMCVEVVQDGFDIETGKLYTNSVNSDLFLGAQPGQIRCKIKSKRFLWRDQFRWTVNYRFAYRAEGWQPQVLDIGPHYIAASGSHLLTEFKDETGNPVFGLLDGLGGPLSTDTPPKPSPTDKNPVFLTMFAYPAVAFAPLNIQTLFDLLPTLNQG